ncbi:hypothetical protein BC834DRAFT_621062 [Gloeopeniophorella convolvens]|nr:hypothetical protein BC834DRAFT_621062 [Gloeopeniophorella convolvens]
MSYYVQSTPSHQRGRSYSLSQPQGMPVAGSGYPYPGTPYSGYTSIPSAHSPYSANQTFYVAPSTTGRTRSRSRSRTRHGHSHSHHGHGHGHGHHGHHHHRRSHSTASHRPHHSTGYHDSSRAPRYVATSTHSHQPHRSHQHQHSNVTIGDRIRSFFGLSPSPRYVDQHGRSVDRQGRPTYKY